MVASGNELRVAELRAQLAEADAELENATGWWAKLIAFLTVLELCRLDSSLVSQPLEHQSYAVTSQTVMLS